MAKRKYNKKSKPTSSKIKSIESKKEKQNDFDGSYMERQDKIIKEQNELNEQIPLTFEQLNRLSLELDVRQKLVNVTEKEKFINKWEDARIKNDSDRLNSEKERLNIDKLFLLNHMINSSIMDEEKTVFGSEPFFKNTYDEKERYILKGKIFDLIKKI